MKFEAIFFDVSGTLIDESSDEQAHAELIQTLIAAHNLKGEFEASRNLFEREFQQYYHSMIDANEFHTLGLLHAHAFKSLLTNGVLRTKDSRPQVKLTDIANLSNQLHAQYARAFPSSLKVLRLCRDLGFHVGIISDFDTKPLLQILKKTGIAELCNSVTGSEQVRRYKPSPDMFLTALKKAGCMPAQAIYFGDRWERDVVGAKKVGMYSCLIGDCGKRDPSPDYVLATIDEAGSLIRDQFQ